MSVDGHLSILFVCRNNAGLSLMAEAIALDGLAGAPARALRRVRAFSAAAAAPAPVDAVALECLNAAGVPADGLSSKPVELFGFSGAPRIDLAVAMVAEARHALERLPWHGLVRLKCWAFEDVSHLADISQRRSAYRRLLPRLGAAIHALLEEEAELPARAA